MTHPRTAGFDAARRLLKTKLGAEDFSPGLVDVLDAVLDAAGVPRVTAAADALPPPLPGLGQPLDPDIARVSAALIRVACPTLPIAELEPWVEPIRKACVQFEINSIRRVAAFIAQLAHESLCFTALNENMNYRSAERIKAIFGQGDAGRKRFPTLDSCRPYVGQPEKLANYVYANRMGNGPPASGDGWRFRGGAGIHLTGRRNWQGFADAMGMPLDQALAYGRTVEGAIMAAAWFWETNDINRLADTPGVADESRAINGGTNGLADRTVKFDALVAAMLRLERGEKP